MKLLFLIIPMILVGCSTTLEYEDDTVQPALIQAGPSEFPVFVNKAPCVDMDFKLGLCSKRVQADHDIHVSMDPLPYDYKITVQSSDSLGVKLSQDVVKETPWELVIDHSKFDKVKSFTLIGEVFPKASPETVSAKWELRVKVVDPTYVGRERMHLLRDGDELFLVTGSHALYSRVCEKDVCQNYTKVTMVPIKDANTVTAYSQSKYMRFNQFGFTGVDYE